MAKNLCGKSRSVENPYEVWSSPDGSWVWKVLKKYKSPEAEAKDPYARWFCAVSSPFTFGNYDLGDVYVREVKRNAVLASPGSEAPGEPYFNQHPLSTKA